MEENNEKTLEYPVSDSDITTQNDDQTPVEAEAPHKPSRKERKALKKEKRKQRRKEKREAFKALCTKCKVIRIACWVAAIAAVVALVVFAALRIGTSILTSYINEQAATAHKTEAPIDEILEMAPLDTEGEKRVAATKAYDPNDTWVIYMYLCGSDLEDCDRNSLSDTAAYYAQPEGEAYLAERRTKQQTLFHTFLDGMQQQGIALPSYLFLPVETAAYSESGESEASTRIGAATNNLRDMLTVELPENVSVVIQTGGAKDWSLPQINPNATQRFIYDAKGFREISSTYPLNMGNPDTLADFLRFCKTEHPADHEMLLFWNHGGGVTGFCNDRLYNMDCITLPEMTGVLEALYGASPAEPPFELIGYDACLMANLETAEMLHGYTRYLAASEELEYGNGWRYDLWLKELAEHPEMNGAQLGKAIADSFVESNARFSINLKMAAVESVATFSVTDVEKAHKVHEAYAALASAALKDTAQDPWPLAAFGRAASSSVRYGGSAYKTINMIDLGKFMGNLSADYPKETAAVLQALDDAVLYHRETFYTKGSSGLSVFFPTDVDSLSGLLTYLSYLQDACVDENIKTLYYYKIAGCLNEELQSYVAAQKLGTFAPLDLSALLALSAQEPSINPDNSVEVQLSNGVASLTQQMSVCIAQYRQKDNTIRFYGDDNCLALDEYRSLSTSFDGTWITLEGQPLYLEIIDETDTMTRYRSSVKYNGDEGAYLMIGCDRETGELSILGYQDAQQDADFYGRNLKPVSVGDRITPCYRTEYLEDVSIGQSYGKQFRYTQGTKLERALLPSGEYYLVITIRDIRGDEYYPVPVSFSMQNGKITNMAVVTDLSVTMSAN